MKNIIVTLLMACMAAFACHAEIEDRQDSPRFGEAEHLSPGCGTRPPQVQGLFFNESMTLASGPSPRDFRIGLPPNYDPNEPHALFFSFHACGGSHTSVNGLTADAMRNTYGIPTITVSPNSAIADAGGNRDAQGTDGQKCWNLNPSWYDLAFVEAVRNHMLENYCIDERNLFASGGSSGSFASQGFGCRMEVSALAGDRGGIHHPQNVFFDQTPPPEPSACGPVPTLIGFAMGDPTVPFSPYGETSRDFWIENNECAETSTQDLEAEARVCHSGLTGCTCQSYDGCAEPFVLCTWDGDHSATSMSPGTSAWWFQQHLDGGGSVPSETGTGTGAEPSTSGSVGGSEDSSTTGSSSSTGAGSGSVATSTSEGDETGASECVVYADDFVLTMDVDPSAWPIAPYCDQCQSAGIEDAFGGYADFQVRWSNGLDPRLPGEVGLQWVEQRPTHANRPTIQVVGSGSQISMLSYAGGVSRTDLTGANPLSGEVDVSAMPAFVTSYLLEGPTCSRGSGSEPPPPPPPPPAPVGCESLVWDDFEVVFEMNNGEFPITPYCDACTSIGVFGSTEGAVFDVRWSNGLDPRMPGDVGIQWIEQRPSFSYWPYVRIVGTPTSLSFDRSSDGMTWSTSLSGENPFSGEEISVNSDADIVTSVTCF